MYTHLFTLSDCISMPDEIPTGVDGAFLFACQWVHHWASGELFCKRASMCCKDRSLCASWGFKSHLTGWKRKLWESCVLWVKTDPSL